ncbi:hypothetical protein [uncultured Roseivirga sp.]|uniref:hypothetical protein n=1 Tax=uncultured Roseivirga sp. TaxID=543088 RepID=UPI0030D99075
MAELLRIEQNTVWLIKQKVLKAMKSSQKHFLNADVQMDKFEIAIPRNEKQGRDHSDHKVRVIFAAQHREGKSSKAYMKVIYDFSNMLEPSLFSPTALTKKYM